jgi:4-hydroxy-3-methylbut-2-enyl diphosphate reductase IspH
MRTRRTLAFLVFAFCLLFAVVKNHAADVRSGDWTIRHSDEAGKVEFSLIEHHHGGNSNHASDWPTASFPGVDFSRAGRQDVHFTITRDAGKIECEGFLNNGEGAGIFHFQPDPAYSGEMHKIGFEVDDEKQYSMAVQDVSLEFARQMKDEHLSGLDADKLIAFRIFGVDSAFIKDLRDAGLKISDTDKLVAFRIHGVTPQMIRALHAAGYSPDQDTLIAMRIHGATPEFVEELKKRGYDHLDLEKLIAFRIHGVSPDFIEKLQGLGYKHPDPDQLVAMRIHRVTPEYIGDLRSRGMRDLSIDQLVNMRIHGID